MTIQEIKHKHNSFPALLRDIATPPKQLYKLGDVPDLPMVAIVGTRRPTEYGRQMTYRIAYDLANAGFCIVSGLAYGIDTISHQATLDASGKTVAVLGCGLDTIYPVGNRSLAIKILESGGAIISEYPVGTIPFKSNFPARNRIIAGLCLATIITEADAKSGSLITANFALQENRQVMAVPGNATSLRSAGPNQLIKSGAKLVTNAVDVLAELGLASDKIGSQRAMPASKQEEMILGLITDGLSSTEQMIEAGEFEPSELATILSLMEITGKIRNLGAGQWVSN